MKTYLLPALFVVLLATAIVTQAQFTPPTTKPNCNPVNPYDPDCGVPPPINVGPQAQTKKGPLTIEGASTSINLPNIFEVKNGNIFLKNARIISDSNAINSNPAWSLANPLSQIFALDTDGAVSAHGLMSTNYIYATSDIYSAALSLPSNTPNYASIPAQRSLCADKATGKIITCGTTTTPTGGPNTPSTPQVTIRLVQLAINDVVVPVFSSPNSLLYGNDHVTVSTPNSKLDMKWEVDELPANPAGSRVTCWSTGTITQSMNNGATGKVLFINGYRINKDETISLTCRHLDTGQVVHKNIQFDYAAGNSTLSPSALPADARIHDTEGTIRWRENTMPIKLTTTIKPNGATTTCTKYASIYSSQNKTIIANNPWTNNTNIPKYHGTTGDTTAYSIRNQIIIDTDFVETKEYKCSDFVVNCPHAAEGTVSVNISIECSNGNQGQTPSSPVRASTTLQWINPDSN